MHESLVYPEAPIILEQIESMCLHSKLYEILSGYYYRLSSNAGNEVLFGHKCWLMSEE